MSKEKDFEEFLHIIEPSQTTKKYISDIQINLRDFLESHETYKEKVVETFLTGSYAKHTCIRPSKYDEKTDVDIAIVTNYTENDNSKEVLDELYKVCKERYNNVTKQSRSIGIEMEGTEIDVVPMIEDKILSMYKIGNKKGEGWKQTNPEGHIEWCRKINKENNDKFVRIVKIFKWWRKNNCEEDIKYPKGITLEKIIADNLYDCNNTYEDIVFNTMKNITNTFRPYIENGIKPVVVDPGILTDNLSDCYEFQDFNKFYSKLKKHIDLLEKTNFSNESWRLILGTEFPMEQIQSNTLSETLKCKYNVLFDVPYKAKPNWNENSNVQLVDVKVKCYDQHNYSIDYNPEGDRILDKGINIDFTVAGAAAFSNNTKIFWQIVNTGDEAKENNCLRGEFESPNISHNGRSEYTLYTGTHWVQAFIINDGVCIAKSKEILVRVK